MKWQVEQVQEQRHYAGGLRMIKGGNKFELEEQIRSRQLALGRRGGMNKTSVGDLLGSAWLGRVVTW